jgi:hypothetical protein
MPMPYRNLLISMPIEWGGKCFEIMDTQSSKPFCGREVLAAYAAATKVTVQNCFAN